ncbi:MAG: hypothetical protein BRD50_00300, partial [Bacteroidetes bacterium SW_11_45_7]
IKGSNNGTTTNEKGYYELTLDPGQYTIVFQYVSYERLEKQVSLQKGEEIQLNATLKPQKVELNEVIVTGEDPGDRIMRKVIANRKKHLNQVEAYSCKTYIKGVYRLTGAPEQIMGQGLSSPMLDSNNTGIVYLSESKSNFYYEQPNKTREVMTASKVSGNKDRFSANFASFLELDIYQNNIKNIPGSDRMFISPASANAFFYYNFSYQGSYSEQGHLIHEIELTPKRNNAPAFQGSVYVVDSLWRFKSIDLQVSKTAELKNYDSLRFKQVYEPLNDTVWMPLSKRIEVDMSFDLLNVTANGYYVNVYSNYKLRDQFPDGFFSSESIAIGDSAKERDSVYWQNKRPVPLTQEEKIDYETKDSIYQKISSQEYLDSMDREYNRFQFFDVITGYNFRKRSQKFRFSTDPIYDIIQYNTVEGAVINFGMDLTKGWEDEQELKGRADLRYGFTNGHLNGKLAMAYVYNPYHEAKLGIEGGQFIRQFDPTSPVTPLSNTLYSLLLNRNDMKIFEQRYVNAYHKRELWNGVKLNTGFLWADRYSLRNRTDYKWIDWENRTFTSNIPGTNGERSRSRFENHQTFNLKADLSLNFGQEYISYPHRKVVVSSPYPELAFHYRKSIPGVLGSDQNFDYIAASIDGDFPLGLVGNTDFYLSAGTYLNQQRLYFPDYKHFHGNVRFLGNPSIDAFERLPYYKFSTIQNHAEAHISHHFDGFLFNKIPAIRKWNIQAVGEVRGFYLPNGDYHLEASAGIENIINILPSSTIEYVFAFPDRGNWYLNGIKLTIGGL